MTGKRNRKNSFRGRPQRTRELFTLAVGPGRRFDSELLPLTFDGEGIVMRHDALRPATAWAAAARRKLPTHLVTGREARPALIPLDPQDSTTCGEGRAAALFMRRL